MEDRDAPDADAAVVTEAYGAARALLLQAEEDAARIRAEADRYRRQREQEAELIVAKARRVLTMAEEHAAAPRPAVVDVDRPGPEGAVRDEPEPDAAGPPPQRTETALDAILAAAVSNAVHRAMPSDP